MRQYWVCLLRNCIDKYAQEHPLYSLFSSVLSTLSKVTCTSDSSTSPSTTGGTFLFSYPQCRIVDKTAVGNEEYAAISAYPDFGLLRSTITQLSDGHTVQLEQIKLLVEVKRLYRGDEGRRLSKVSISGLTCTQLTVGFGPIERTLAPSLRGSFLPTSGSCFCRPIAHSKPTATTKCTSCSSWAYTSRCSSLAARMILNPF